MSDEKTEEQRAAEEHAAAYPGPRVMVVEGNDLSGFLGVAPEYMNYATPAGKPYLTEEEAYKYTDLSDDQVLATRDREYENENERPAVAEGTGFDFAENKKREEEAAAARENEDDEDGDGKKDGGEEVVVSETTANPQPLKPTTTRPPLAGSN